MHYYNENDPKAAAWLRELIRRGLIPFGYVDTRSITEVRATDLVRYVQCHFFAGIGGWALALRLAGWPEDRPVWTGSCPCQPFSAAGKQRGTEDERHLWPVFRDLIQQCNPPAVFGEQVASKLGREWLHGVRTDLEALGYAVGAADLCAAGVGAPHIRQRLYWVADASGNRWAQHEREPGSGARRQKGPEDAAERCGIAVRMADAQGERWNRRPDAAESSGRGIAEAGCRLDLSNRAGRDQGRQAAASMGYRSAVESAGGVGGMEYTESDGREQWRAQSGGRSATGGCGISGVGQSIEQGLEGHAGDGTDGSESRRDHSREAGPASTPSIPCPWSEYDLIPCADGKARRIEPGTFPLAHGVPHRVAKLRGLGNAIVPQLAASFVQAFVEATA